LHHEKYWYLGDVTLCNFSIVSNIKKCLFAANVDRSNLYLKLFKLVFGSVSLLANENEQMLKVSQSFSYCGSVVEVHECL